MDNAHWIFLGYLIFILVIALWFWSSPSTVKEKKTMSFSTDVFNIRPSKGWPNTIEKVRGTIRNTESGLYEGWFHISKVTCCPVLGQNIWIEVPSSEANFDANVVRTEVVEEWYSIWFTEKVKVPEPSKVEVKEEEIYDDISYGKNRFVMTRISEGSTTSLPEGFAKLFREWMKDEQYYLEVPYGWKLEKIVLDE